MNIVDIPEFKDRKEILTVTKDINIKKAASMMKKHNVGAAIVVDKEGKLIGIVTERDYLMKVAAEKKDTSDLKIADIMTSKVKTAKFDDTVYDSMRRMSQGKFRHLPIIDDEGRVTGIVSQGDFVAITWSQLFHQFKNQTKASIFTHTQVWTMALAIMIYTTLLFVIFK